MSEREIVPVVKFWADIRPTLEYFCRVAYPADYPPEISSETSAIGAKHDLTKETQ